MGSQRAVLKPPEFSASIVSLCYANNTSPPTPLHDARARNCAIELCADARKEGHAQPNMFFIWPTPIVMAAPDWKPDMTGRDMRFMMLPNLHRGKSLGSSR